MEGNPSREKVQMFGRYTLATLAIVTALAGSATAATTARQFTHPIGTYERAIARGLDPLWKNTGTECEFRSGRTLVYCITIARKWGRIQSTMRRNSATTIRINIRFIDQGCPSCGRTWTIKGT